jgi:hypothetical protein
MDKKGRPRHLAKPRPKEPQTSGKPSRISVMFVLKLGTGESQEVQKSAGFLAAQAGWRGCENDGHEGKPPRPFSCPRLED